MSNSANLDEYGQFIRFNVNEDISQAVVTLELYPPNETVISKSSADGVTVPGSDITLDDGTVYSANEYAQYTIEQGVLSKIGTWKIRLVAEFSSPAKRLKTDFQTFPVNR